MGACTWHVATGCNELLAFKAETLSSFFAFGILLFLSFRMQGQRGGRSTQFACYTVFLLLSHFTILPPASHCLRTLRERGQTAMPHMKDA